MTNSTFSIHRVDCRIFQWKGWALGIIHKFLVLDLMWSMIDAGSKRRVVYLQTVNFKKIFQTSRDHLWFYADTQWLLCGTIRRFWPHKLLSKIMRKCISPASSPTHKNDSLFWFAFQLYKKENEHCRFNILITNQF